MPSKKPVATKPNPAKQVVQVVIDDPNDRVGALRSLGGSKSDKWDRKIADQVYESLWTGHGDPERMVDHLNGTAGALVGIKPSDELEGMLAAQLIAAHNAVMECYRRATLPNQSLEGRQAALNQAGKLSRTFSSLIDTLHRQRGRAQQKVIVEHVHIHNGGQAVVGVVNRPGGAPAKTEEQSHAKQLTDASQPTLRCEDAFGDALQIPCDGERPV